MIQMTTEPKKLMIVGAGITGLSAAYYLRNFFKANDTPVHITLVEKKETLGGKIDTLHKEGFIIEKGPDSFLARKMSVIDLTRELGLEGELTGTNPQAKKTYISHKGKLHLMPPGLILGIPTEVTPFMKTGLISLSGKARAALDLFLPKRTEQSDESLGHFLERRLGREVLENIAEPLLAGIYAGDTKYLSLKATFPQFYQVEQKYRSLILGMLASKQKVPQTPNLPDIAKKSMFLTYKQGLVTLVNKLEESLEENIHILRNKSIISINKQENGYALTLDDGNVHQADGLILTLPPPITANLLEKYIPSSDVLRRIEYVSVANIVMAFEQKDIEHPLDGSGVLVPRKEGRYITACTWTSSKWLHTAPQGKVLIRCYVGRSGDEEIVHLKDEELVKKVRHDLMELIGLTATPLFHEITRWPRSMPQYPVGHVQNIANVRQALATSLPGVFITGSGFEGVGIPDCIAQGKQAAKQLSEFLQ